MPEKKEILSPERACLRDLLVGISRNLCAKDFSMLRTVTDIKDALAIAEAILRKEWE